jgi:hypothetical protein
MSNKDTYSILGSSGSIETYQDAFSVSAEDQEASASLEEYIIGEKQAVETSFLKLGAALALFESNKHYRGRGFESMKAWLGSPEISISYRLAHDLIRVSSELVPKLGDIGNTSISTLREMLPMLSDGTSDEELLEAFGEVQGMTTKDAKQTIREKRGIEQETDYTTFKAQVQRGNPYHRVTVTCFGEGEDTYTVTSSPMQIKAEHFAKWQKFFGKAVEYS